MTVFTALKYPHKANVIHKVGKKQIKDRAMTLIILILCKENYRTAILI